VLLERVDPQVHRSRDPRPKQATCEPANQSSLTWKCTFQLFVAKREQVMFPVVEELVPRGMISRRLIADRPGNRPLR
jgi:hypothetical protein